MDGMHSGWIAQWMECSVDGKLTEWDAPWMGSSMDGMPTVRGSCPVPCSLNEWTHYIFQGSLPPLPQAPLHKHSREALNYINNSFH